MKTFRSALAAGLVLAQAGCMAPVDADPATEGDEELGSVEQAVQTSYYRNTATPQIDYAAWTDDVQATGAVFVPMRRNGAPVTKNGIAARYTCGVTFVTAHYAITAAHCVDSTAIPDPATQAIKVEQYHIEWCPRTKLEPAENVSGFYPFYQRTQLTEADNYYVSRYQQCKVVKRCSYGKYNCTELDADIALIRCDDRPSNAPSIAVASSDPQTGPVQNTWYHEVLNMPIVEPQPPANPNYFNQWIYLQAKDTWDHYTLYNSTTPEDNFHYLDANQLFPLRSVPWPNGTPRRRLSRSGSVVWTDLFGCHGTSGSGVFQINPSTNKPELLGPVANGANWAYSRLCTDTASFGPGVANISYTANEYTRVLANWARLRELQVVVIKPGVLQSL